MTFTPHQSHSYVILTSAAKVIPAEGSKTLEVATKTRDAGVMRYGAAAAEAKARHSANVE